jgi:hypothetical protein
MEQTLGGENMLHLQPANDQPKTPNHWQGSTGRPRQGQSAQADLTIRFCLDLKQVIHAQVDACSLSSSVLDIVSLVKDDDVTMKIDVNFLPDEGVDDVVVRAEDDISLLCQLARCIIRAPFSVFASFHQVLDVMHLQ